VHAVLTSFGTDGDVFPYLGLARVLIERGHQVTLAIPEPFEASAHAIGAQFVPILTCVQSEAILSNPDLWHPLKGGIVAARWGRPLIRHQLNLLKEIVSQKPHVIIANPGVLAARIIREIHDIPLVSILLQPGLIPSCIAPPVMPFIFSLKPSTPRWMKESYWWSIDLFAHFLTGRELDRVRREYGLAPLGRLFRWWLSPDLVLGMFPEWYGNRPADWPSNLVLIDFPRHDGRSISSLSEEAQQFFDAGAPPVAFTPGSEVRNATAYFEQAIEACQQLGRRAILLTKHGKSIPAKLPETVRHFEYLPFQQAFERCAAVVHHGGIGTVAKGLMAGVPQVIRPLGWDQFDNADRLNKLGVGTSVNQRWSRANPFLDPLRRSLESEVRSRSQEIAMRFVDEDPNVRAIQLIESKYG
jgi:UDP:flavonoid glycosyltransferase YjiC (YdhE family)